jgi:hypothetical protein
MIEAGSLLASWKPLLLLFVLTLSLVNPWVRGDGVGYYAFLRSLLIDHNLRFESDYLAGNQSFVSSRVDNQGHLLPSLYTKTGYVENHFTIGPAILWAPVMVIVHGAVLLVDQLGGHIPADGYSRPYLLAMALTTACYGFVSLLFSFGLAKKYFGPQWSFFATLAIWLASSLPVYMYFNPSWSHAHSAFAVALFLWYWERTRPRRTAGQWAVLGLLAGLMGNIYYPNITVLIFPLGEVVWQLSGEAPGPFAARLRELFFQCAVFVAALLCALAPTFITRQIIYGSPLATGYPAFETWNWTSPVLFKVLFSSDHGLLSWTPVLILAVVGFAFVIRRDALLGLGSIATFVVYWYFIAAYPNWDGISSYGNRFFISLTPLFILGLAALLSAFAKWLGNTARAVQLASSGLALLVLWNLGLIFQWGTHMIPARGEISWSGMVRNQVVSVPLQLTRNVESYFLHRSELMQHIEQGDVEQQKLEKPSGE